MTILRHFHNFFMKKIIIKINRENYIFDFSFPEADIVPSAAKNMYWVISISVTSRNHQSTCHFPLVTEFSPVATTLCGSLATSKVLMPVVNVRTIYFIIMCVGYTLYSATYTLVGLFI